MRRSAIVFLLLFSVICLFGCSSSSGSSAGSAANNYNSGVKDHVSGDPIYEESSQPGEGSSADMEGGGQNGAEELQQVTERTINQEMLVYTCSISIDVLEFDEAVDSFRSLLEEYEGFVEHENYSDDKGSVSYYQENAEVWHDYTATVRVPSSRYEDFTESISGIGDLRSKNAQVENVSQEYTDAQTTLAIYEAKQERYLNMLSTITDEAYALEVENQLTELEIQIAQLKTRMNDIETDVAYSYVNISIHEVKEYEKKPVKTDTFRQRLGNTINRSWGGFLEFAEAVLFMVIYLFPYMVIVGMIILIVLLCLNRKYKIFGRKKRVKEQPQEQQK